MFTYRLLTDGSTDSSIKNEAVYFDYCDPDKITVTTGFMKLVFLQSGDAIGRVESVDGAFKSIGIKDFHGK